MRSDVLALLTIVAAACGPAAAPAPTPTPAATTVGHTGGEAPIVVGVVLPLTGPMRDFGASIEGGARLAADLAGRVLDRPVELIAVDSQGTAAGAAEITATLLAEHRPHVVIGEVTSAATLALAPLTDAAGVPLIAPAATAPDVTEVGPRVFALPAPDARQGQVAAAWALARGHRRAALAVGEAAYSEAVAAAFEATFTAAGGAIVAREPYAPGATDFAAALGPIVAGRPDVVFVPGYYPDVIALADAARARGLTAPLLGSDGWDAAELVAHPTLDGAAFVNHFAADDPGDAARAFAAAWTERHGAPPDALAALGHDAVVVALDAIRRAGGTEPDAVADALRATNLTLATGRLAFDADRRPVRDLVVVRLDGGAAVFDARLAPAGR